MAGVSVVIPTWNEARAIARTIESVRACRPREIIVADGGSSDETATIARDHDARVVISQRGRGVQLHAGALAAGGDVLWFLHADTAAPSDAIGAIRTAFADPAVAGGCFSLRFAGSSRVARQLNVVYPWLGRFGLTYGDSGMFVRRDAYQRLGGFRPVPLFEDLDLFRRLPTLGRVVRLDCALETSARRFENRAALTMWSQWVGLQLAFWAGVSPTRLARWYDRETVTPDRGQRDRIDRIEYDANPS